MFVLWWQCVWVHMDNRSCVNALEFMWKNRDFKPVFSDFPWVVVHTLSRVFVGLTVIASSAPHPEQESLATKFISWNMSIPPLQPHLLRSEVAIISKKGQSHYLLWQTEFIPNLFCFLCLCPLPHAFAVLPLNSSLTRGWIYFLSLLMLDSAMWLVNGKS